MNKIKKLVALTVCLLLLTAVFAGCSKSSSTGTASPMSTSTGTAAPTATSTDTAAPTADPNAEKVDLSVAVWDIQTGFDSPGAANDTIFNNLTAKFNVKIKPVQVSWSDYTDKLKVLAASSQLPDIFGIDLATDAPALYKSWAKQGVIQAIPDDLSKYPTLEKIMKLPSVAPLKVDGKFYMIPRMTYQDSSDWVMDRAIAYRKDWAQEAGFSNEPKNFEEFKTMLKTVGKAHPNTTPLVINSGAYITSIFLGSFPEFVNPKTWVMEDGKWIPSQLSKKMNEGITQLRTLYSEGLIDKDFAISNKDDQAYTKFLSGNAFAISANKIEPKFIDAFKKGNPGKKIEDAIGYIKLWPAADGNRYVFTETPYWSETFLKKGMDDKKIDRALQLLDYMASEEYIMQYTNGLEGVDYKVEDGKSISTLPAGETIAKKYPITNVFGLLAAWNNGFVTYSDKMIVSNDPDTAYLNKLTSDTAKDFKASAKPIPINFDMMLLSTPEKDKVASILSKHNDEIIKVVVGKEDPIKMYQDVLKMYDSKGIQDLIAKVNATAAQMGIK